MSRAIIVFRNRKIGFTINREIYFQNSELINELIHV